MDLLAQYSVSDDEGGPSTRGGSEPPEAPKLGLTVSTAPQVDTTGMMLFDGRLASTAEHRKLLAPNARSVNYNLPLEDMAAPLVGPAHPYQKDGLAAGLKNHRSGFVEDTHMHAYAFEEQYNQFHAQGRGQAPSGIGVVGQGGDQQPAKRRKTTAERKAAAQARADQLAAEQATFDPAQPFAIQQRAPWKERAQEVVELTEEQKEFMEKYKAEREEVAAAAVDRKGASTVFHGKQEKDYQGRSWLAPPREKKSESDTCYLPKKWVHTWQGHTQGVNAIRFFPKTGHMLLSAGLDGKVKIWDVFGTMKCMRTYMGHSKGVKDINFTNDGKRFVTVGYDKNIRLWDTETGQVIRTINNGKQFFCGVFHPDDGQQNVLMAGCGDKKIYQWDLDTGDAVQEYNYHLGAVNTVTFFDDGRRFVSSSDDKTLRVWEFGIPVQIKYIADPSMHSMPAITPTPDHKQIMCQSLDNQILCYTTTGGKFKANKRKTFKGHNTAGYACQVNMSPDQKYVMSGDSEGKAYFWEWAHPQKVVRSIKAHDKVCMGIAWHPLESSKVATCSWDGLIKYWD